MSERLSPESSQSAFKSKSSEQLQAQLEVLGAAESLPAADEVEEMLTSKIIKTLPEEIRPYQDADGNKPGIVTLFDNPQTGLNQAEEKQAVRSQYAQETSKKLAGDCWWVRSERTIEKWGTPPEEARSAMILREAHTFTVLTPDGVAGEYQLYECGSEEGKLTDDEMSAITETLKLIDQFSGGVMVGSVQTRRIITTAAHIPHSNSDTQDVGGYADYVGTVLNLREIRRLASESQIDVGVMLSAVLIHENLGHQLERIGYGGTGRLFKEYFNYSDEKNQGKLFESIHSRVTAKDSAQLSSRPVREYGYVNASEDLATSTDAMVASAMSWDKQLTKSERAGSTADPYRFKIIISMMDEIAKRIKEDQGIGTGFVGSPISYTQGPNGLEVTPARTLVHNKKTAEAVVQEELDHLASPYQHLEELVYKVIDPKELIY